MRLASYNHMFGCNGRSLSEFLQVHALHMAQSYDNVARRADLQRTAATIRESNADIVAITEVLGEKQRHTLMDALKPSGYSYFHVGRGHGLGQKYGGVVETLLATRMPSDSVYAPEFKVPDELGYGGGVVGIHVPDFDLYVIQLHLPLNKGKTQGSFLQHVRSILCEITRIKAESSRAKVIVMGDFNCIYNDLIRFFPEFMPFRKLSADVSTCSTTNLLRWFYSKNLDYILGMGLEAQRAGVIEGASDHRLVWVDIHTL